MDSTRNGERLVQIFVDADAVDYKLISICHKGDVVVSQDYGVAAMALGKGVYAIHQSGKLDRLKNHILPSRGMFFL